jgi:ATP synthase protein I
MGNKSIAYRIVLSQLGIALVLAAVCLAIWGKSTAVAALVGGAINIITNLYVALRLFGKDVVRSARQVLQRFYAAEAVKFALTFGLFALGIGVLKLNALPLLVGYGLTLVVYWLALLPARQDLELAERAP